MPEPRVLVLVCTYNERENLGLLVPEIRRVLPQADLMVIDDGSPDGTGQAATQLAQADSHLRVLHRDGKKGLGSAIVAGFEEAIAQGYEYVMSMDADFSHDPQYLPALLDGMQRADITIGSRYVPGGGIQGWGLGRHFMSRAINWYARAMLGLTTRDNSGGFRCYRVSALAQLDFAGLHSRGFAFQEEILYRLWCAGCRLEETPIEFHDRRYGASKMNWRESAAALWIIWRLRLENLQRGKAIRH
jgi:dolichol-phosphate mannosyltransferase